MVVLGRRQRVVRWGRRTRRGQTRAPGLASATGDVVQQRPASTEVFIVAQVVALLVAIVVLT